MLCEMMQGLFYSFAFSFLPLGQHGFPFRIVLMIIVFPLFVNSENVPYGAILYEIGDVSLDFMLAQE
jgi:hypothetical protein